MISQYEFSLPSFSRGYHVITDLVMKHLDDFPDVGILNLFIKHTSAAVTINESADPDVLSDFESIFNHIIPENLPFLKHTMEGADDMPAHIKAAMIGCSIQIPITNGRLNLGTWQGIYLCEFRNLGGARKLVATVIS
ncbi:MAG TPA: secondary thiamine-phosphate synthase [Saprospirales bacterium]|nr:secondary thiamine-phosphate synthase [Saprospirales bacterium]